jgi:YD repeat-containing protein
MSSKLFRRSLLALGLTSAINIPLAHATERSWSYTYNGQGLIETSDGPRTDVSDVTRYEYDDRNRLTRIINALGHTIRIEDFDGYGNPQKITDANGVISLIKYTPQGWLTSSTTAGSTTSIEYNAVGDITKLTRGDGSWLEYTWDDARRLVSIANNAGERINSDLNPMGKPIARRLHDNLGRVTHQREWVYDEIGRILEVIGAAGQTRKFNYDLNNNPIENNDPSNNKTQAAFDPLNRLVKNVNPLDGLSRYDYDAQDNVTQVVDPRGVVTRYEYDAHDSLTHLDSPDSGKHTFLRDAAGNVTQKTDGRGIATIYTYDALNRLVNRQHQDKPELNIRFIYDETSDRRNGVGRLTSIKDSNGTMRFSYDEKGKLKDQTQTLKIGVIQYSESIRFGYSQGDQVVRIDYPSQITIEYERNSTGQVNAVRWRPQGSEPLDLATNLTYLPFGPLASLDWASGHNLRRE